MNSVTQPPAGTVKIELLESTVRTLCGAWWLKWFGSWVQDPDEH